MSVRDRKAHLRAIIQRLKRWAAIDAFAASKEPGLRDEYNARASVTALLAEVMEQQPGRTPHEALQLLETLVRSKTPPPGPTLYRKSDLPSERPLFPRAILPPRPSDRITHPASPHGRKTQSNRPTLFGIPTVPPPPGYGDDLTDLLEPDDEPA